MDSKKKQLLVIVSGLRAAGAELMLFRMIKHLDRRYFNVNVVSLTAEGDVGMMLTSQGIRVHALHIDGLIKLIVGFFRLIWLIKKICPDVVQTWMYHADLMGGLASRIAGVTNIAWSIRNSSLSFDTTKISTYSVAKLCSVFSSWVPKVIINCSENALDYHVAFGYNRKKMVVVPNGFELDRFAPICGARNAIRSELCLSSERQIVGLIGRYHPIKNHAGFIRAAIKIASIDSSVDFLLAGEGVDTSNSELLRLIHGASLSNRFHLLGQRSDMPVIMSSLDVLVSASFGEAFPNVIGEAMACGVPCVATDVGDTAFIIGDTGKMVAVDDSESLATSVLEILALKLEDRKFLGLKARERITHNFDIKIISSAYQRYYERML
jgi:glycosyltransferase involved in cell wall biosynthesis